MFVFSQISVLSLELWWQRTVFLVCVYWLNSLMNNLLKYDYFIIVVIRFIVHDCYYYWGSIVFTLLEVAQQTALKTMCDAPNLHICLQQLTHSDNMCILIHDHRQINCSVIVLCKWEKKHDQLNWVLVKDSKMFTDISLKHTKRTHTVCWLISCVKRHIYLSIPPH